jgi:hypothetical protein
METTPKHTGKQVGLAVLNLIFVLLTIAFISAFSAKYKYLTVKILFW